MDYMFQVTHLMYLNIGSEGKSMNKVIGNVNGVSILQYGHINTRYYDRISRMYETTNINNLRYDKMIKIAELIIKRNFNRCVTRDRRQIRNKIVSKFTVETCGQLFVIEVAILIKSTKVEWGESYPKEVAKDYIEYVNNGELNIDDTVISIETIAASIRLEDEDDQAFTKINKIGTIRLPIDHVELSFEDFMYMVDPLLRVSTMRTEKANNVIKELRKGVGCKC